MNDGAELPCCGGLLALVPETGHRPPPMGKTFALHGSAPESSQPSWIPEKRQLSRESSRMEYSSGALRSHFVDPGSENRNGPVFAPGKHHSNASPSPRESKTAPTAPGLRSPIPGGEAGVARTPEWEERVKEEAKKAFLRAGDGPFPSSCGPLGEGRPPVHGHRFGGEHGVWRAWCAASPG